MRYWNTVPLLGLEPSAPVSARESRPIPGSEQHIKARTFPCGWLAHILRGNSKNPRADLTASVVRAEVTRAAKEGPPLYTQAVIEVKLNPMRQAFAVSGHGVVA